MLSITPVILSGGSGTRLWPSSRESYPKQFLPLTSDYSLLQQTIMRLQGVPNILPPVVVANFNHRFLVAEHLRAIGHEDIDIIIEPCAKNTAPAIALAALAQSLKNEDTLLLVLPADHLIQDLKVFQKSLDRAISFCEKDKLVTFGIVPTYAATAFGYIKSGDELEEGVFESSSFVEKPDYTTAEKFIEHGGYSWNSGIFMFRSSVYLSELKTYHPEMVDYCHAAMASAVSDLNFLKVDEGEFSHCQSISIDCAVMEKTPNSVVIPMDAGWDDIGSWSALHDVLDKDVSGNVTRGDVLLKDVNDCLVISDSKLVVALGVDKLILVETDDAILLSCMSRVQEVKSIVQNLKEKDRPEAFIHRKVYRPWGNYDSIEKGEGFQVKRLVVKPGEKLSLQLHKYRAEHWVVVRGVAEVTNGDEIFTLNINESTYIPIGVKHSLANLGDIDLEIIEVQSGTYLGEDDIVRFDDVYGRHKE